MAKLSSINKNNRRIKSIEKSVDSVITLFPFEENAYKNSKVRICYAGHPIAYKLNQDIIIADPPWGGTNYDKISRIRLHLNNVDITCIINKLYKKDKFKILIKLILLIHDLQMLQE